MSAPHWLTDRPIAHRGLHDAGRGIVENSPGAVKAAVDGGYAIEIDVRLTADGDAVVYHDTRLERLTEAQGAVIAHSADEIRRISYLGSDECIASLGDVLDLIQGRVPLVVEVKTEWGRVGPLETRVAELLGSYAGDAAIMSFDPRSVALFRRIAPELPRGLISCRFSSDVEWPELSAYRRFILRHFLHLPFTRPHFVSYDVEALPSAELRLLRALGMTVICWTVRSEDERSFALDWTDQVTFEGFIPDPA